jgi:hypothetical protein
MEVERYFRHASLHGTVEVHMRHGMVFLSGQLGRFDIRRAKEEFGQAAHQNDFG